jgi:4-amino-4-deoxy-L-arabinose transferase-like glycosyltransferase/cyclophilin family peptidyl-prolyl cis-trans isomerase
MGGHNEDVQLSASDVGDEVSSLGTLPILDDRESVAFFEPAKYELRVRLVVLAVALGIFLPNLGAFGLWDPWETHYGAVTTNMVETYDWVSPWWGYKEKIGPDKQGKPFYSKPVFIFWSEAMMSQLIGRGEWAIRLPMAMLAILAVFLAYIVMSRIWSRRAGLLGSLLLATSPQFFMISRQAQTDMPFVGTLIIALLLMMLAFFGPRVRRSRRQFWVWTGLTVAFVLLNAVPQYLLISNDLNPLPPVDMAGWGLFVWKVSNVGSYHALGYALLLSAVIAWYGLSLRKDLRNHGLTDRIKDKWLRRHLLIAFYVMAAHSTYSKGLLGFLLPGAIIFCYLLITNTWRLLARVELLRGLCVFVAVGFPWYMAMFAAHGGPPNGDYYRRFFIHDHFNRLASGVHQIDSGTFEHFIKWLGIGVFPWVIFVPFTLAWLVRHKIKNMAASNQAKLFLGVWFVFAFALFTLASTKFHHYIFPALPALVFLVALFLTDVLENRGVLGRLTAAVGAIFFIGVGLDIKDEPQQIRNLMTYKYDRKMPKNLPIDAKSSINAKSDLNWEDSYFYKHTDSTLHSILNVDFFRYERFIDFLLLLGCVALGFFFFHKTRGAGLAMLAVLSVMLSMWSLNYYMPSLSPHWSQKYLFDSYYDTCTPVENDEETDRAYRPLLANIGLSGLTEYLRGQQKKVCDEDVIAWRITWRGETYYSFNELQPIIKEKTQFKPYLEERNGGKKFYALMERGNESRLKSRLNAISNQLKKAGHVNFANIKSWKTKIENDENAYFQMVSATPLSETPRFYDALTFYRAISNFIIQTGSSTGSTDGSELKTYTPDDIKKILSKVPGKRGPGSKLQATIKTEVGVIQCELDHKDAPQSVANLVALGTGQTAWTNWKLKREPGKKARWAQPGTMAMVDSGSYNHGNRFFITVRKTELEKKKKYSPFGGCSIDSVALKISEAAKLPPTTEGKKSNKPKDPVTIDRMTFRWVAN